MSCTTKTLMPYGSCSIGQNNTCIDDVVNCEAVRAQQVANAASQCKPNHSFRGGSHLVMWEIQSQAERSSNGLLSAALPSKMVAVTHGGDLCCSWHHKHLG